MYFEPNRRGNHRTVISSFNSVTVCRSPYELSVIEGQRCDIDEVVLPDAYVAYMRRMSVSRDVYFQDRRRTDGDCVCLGGGFEGPDRRALA